jgi:hypothetical protein
MAKADAGEDRPGTSAAAGAEHHAPMPPPPLAQPLVPPASPLLPWVTPVLSLAAGWAGLIVWYARHIMVPPTVPGLVSAWRLVAPFVAAGAAVGLGPTLLDRIARRWPKPLRWAAGMAGGGWVALVAVVGPWHPVSALAQAGGMMVEAAAVAALLALAADLRRLPFLLLPVVALTTSTLAAHALQEATRVVGHRWLLTVTWIWDLSVFAHEHTRPEWHVFWVGVGLAFAAALALNHPARGAR